MSNLHESPSWNTADDGNECHDSPILHDHGRCDIPVRHASGDDRLGPRSGEWRCRWQSSTTQSSGSQQLDQHESTIEAIRSIRAYDGV